MGVENIKVEAMLATYGEDTYQVEKITCVADVASSLNNKYFYMYSSAGVKHYFWFNVAAAGVDPAPDANATGHVVAIAANATASAVATALEAVIEAVTGFDSVPVGAVITVTQNAYGYASAAQDPATGGTGFGLELVTQGDLAEAIGCVNGDMEASWDDNVVEVKCHDTGATVVSKIKTGAGAVTFKLSLLETTKAKLKKVFTKGGGSFTPPGGTEVFGLGTYKDFSNLFKYSKKLTLHPVRLLAGDKTEDVNMWKAFPRINTLTWSGENVFEIPLEFDVFVDSTKNDRINLFAIGDGSQTLT